MSLIIIVTGSRHWEDPEPIHRNLDSLLKEHNYLAVVSGGATGADNIAETWAARNLNVHSFTDPVTDEEWKTHGKAAGVIRNRRLIAKALELQEATQAEIYVLGFPLPGSRGTWDMIGACKEAGFHGKVIQPTEKGTQNE